MIYHFLDNGLYVFILHQFLIVYVHLLEKVDAAHVVLQVRLGHRQQELELFLVLVVVPDQYRQEVVGSVQGPYRQVVVHRQRLHQLVEIDNDQVMVLALYQVLVQLQIAILLSYYHEGTVSFTRLQHLLNSRISYPIIDIINYIFFISFNIVKREETVQSIEVKWVLNWVTFLHHRHRQRSQFLDNSLLLGFHPQDLLGYPRLLDSGVGQVQQHAPGGL